MAVNYDAIRKNYEQGINVDLSTAKRKATQASMARAAGAGLSSASLGSGLDDYFAQLESSAQAQKSGLARQFALLQVQEQIRRDEQRRAQREAAKAAWGQALGTLAGTAVGSVLGPVGAAAGGNLASRLFGTQQQTQYPSYMQQNQLPEYRPIWNPPQFDQWT
jgi:hypothetical protein